MTFIGGDNPSPRPPKDDPICHLIKCLVGEKVISPEVIRMLESKGINLKALLECIESQCRDSDAHLGGEKPYVPGKAHPAAFDPSGFIKRTDLRQVLAQFAEREPGVLRGFDELVQAEPIVKPAVEPTVENFGIDLKNPPREAEQRRRRGRTHNA